MEENAKDFIHEFIDEYCRRYRELTPEQKKEADVQRAYRIVHSIAFNSDISPEIRDIYRSWLIVNIDSEHVEEAMKRLFDNFCDAGQTPDYQSIVGEITKKSHK